MTKPSQNTKAAPASARRRAVGYRHVDDAIADITRIKQIVAELTPDLLNQLAIRAEHANRADGYPTTTSGGNGHGSDIANPTLAAANQRSDHTGLDPIALAIAEAFAGIVEATGILCGVQARKNLVLDAATDNDLPGARGAYCEACGRWVPNSSTDRIRSGMCDACRKAYTRDATPPGGASHQPDSATWKRQRLATTPAESTRGA